MSGAEQESLARMFPIQRMGEPREGAASALFPCRLTLQVDKLWFESRGTEETMKTLLGFLMIANAALFFFGAVQHIGVTIGRFHEPRIIPAAIVETICGISLAWGAAIVLSRAV